MRTSKKAISITLLTVMLISTLAILGINPASAQPTQTQPPGVYYVDGKPYVSMDALRNAPSVTQNDNNKTHLVPQQAHLANGSTTIHRQVIDKTKDGKDTMTALSTWGLTINIDTDDYMGDNTFGRDSTAYVSTTMDASGGHALQHWEARLLRQVTCYNVDGSVVQSDVRWIATQSIGNDVYWEGPSDWTPTFSQSMTLSELCATGSWTFFEGSNAGYASTWENWNRVVVYRIEIKSIMAGTGIETLVGCTDFNMWNEDGPYFGSWAIGHGEMQRFANTLVSAGGLSGNGRVDYASNAVGGQNWGWAYMDGYSQYDTSYLQVTIPEVYSYDSADVPNPWAYFGDLYVFSYVWTGYPSNLWMCASPVSGGTVYMSGNTPNWSNGGYFWYGQVAWTNQQWTRFTASWWTDNNALMIFQQTPAGRYGSNFSIDSIVETPTFVEPSIFT